MHFSKKAVMVMLTVAGICLSASDSGMDYYRDGVYDTTAQINKHLRNGLQEQVMDHYKNRYLVLIDLERYSTVDILFFETVAERNHILDVETVKNTKNNKSYMVFGAFERQADADLISQKMNDSTVTTDVRFNTDVYVKNPIVVKKFLSDIREMIKDMPVKVITIQKTIAKDGKECPSLPIPTMASRQAEQAKIDSDLQNELEDQLNDIDRRWKKSGVVATTKSHISMMNSKIQRTSYFGIGEKIGCFTLKDIRFNNYECTNSLILMGPDGKTYTVNRNSKCANEKIKAPAIQAVKKPKATIVAQKNQGVHNGSAFCKEGTTSDGPEANSKPATATVATQPQASTVKSSSSNTASCDFSKIKFGVFGGKSTTIDKTPYAEKQITVTVSKNGGTYTLQGGGNPPISVRENLFNNGCTK